MATMYSPAGAEYNGSKEGGKLSPEKRKGGFFYA